VTRCSPPHRVHSSPLLLLRRRLVRRGTRGLLKRPPRRRGEEHEAQQPNPRQRALPHRLIGPSSTMDRYMVAQSLTLRQRALLALPQPLRTRRTKMKFRWIQTTELDRLCVVTCVNRARSGRNKSIRRIHSGLCRRWEVSAPPRTMAMQGTEALDLKRDKVCHCPHLALVHRTRSHPCCAAASRVVPLHHLGNRGASPG
jgi:hypothetical protein